MKSKKIILATGDDEFANMITQGLESEGFGIRYCPDQRDVLSAVAKNRADLVIMGKTRHATNGFNLCREIRRVWDGPILFIAEQNDDLDQLLAFELGVDDFVAKPIHPRVLAARVKALYRRAYPLKSNTSGMIKLGNLSISSASREAHLGGRRLELTTVQFDLLWHLAANAGIVISRNEMCLALYDTEYNGIDRSIDVYISRLRQILGDDPHCPTYLKTVRGVGYLFATP